MRLLQLEIKRVLKTKTTWIILLFCILFSALMAYLPTTFYSYHWADATGQQITKSGMDLIDFRKEVESPYVGEVTPEKVQRALTEYQDCLKEYGVKETYDLPKDVYMERIFPIERILHGIREVFADPDTGLASHLTEISPEDVSDYYGRLSIRLDSILDMEQKNHPAAKEKASAIFSKVDTPFIYYPGYNSDALDYQILFAILVVIGCTIISAPIFTSDYQTGADDILRCTKYGRKTLAIVKISSALIICACTFLVCTVATVLISNTLFGWETTKNSIQMLYSITTLASVNVWQFQRMIPLFGAISLLATISLILFISSKVRSNAICMAVSLFVCLSPCFLGAFMTGNVASWLLYALPSAGFGIQTNFFYATIGYEFLHLGNLSFRPVEVMVFSSLVEIPIFLFLAIRSYSRNVPSR